MSEKERKELSSIIKKLVSTFDSPEAAVNYLNELPTTAETEEPCALVRLLIQAA